MVAAMKTFVAVIGIDEHASPDWAAAEEAFAALDNPSILPDSVELLWRVIDEPASAHVRTCVANGMRLYVAAGQEWADDSWALDCISVFFGTGVLEAAGFQVLLDC